MAVHLSPGLNSDGHENTSAKRRPRKLVLFLIVVAMCSVGAAQTGSSGNFSNQIQIQAVNFTLEDFSTTKLVIGVNLAANSNRNVTVDKVMLSELRLNGVPIDAAPLKHRFKLRSDATVILPEPLRITVYLRDVDSLEPLRKAISEGHATVDGLAVIDVPLNPLAKLVLLSQHAEVSTALHQQVAFTVPGGPLAAASLVKILDLAETAFKALDSALTRATKLALR